MWPFLFVGFFAAILGIFAVLNQTVTQQFYSSNAEITASRILLEHEYRINRSRGTDFRPSDDLASSNSNGKYPFTYLKKPYVDRDGYLPFLVKATKNSYLCVGRKINNTFKPEIADHEYCTNEGTGDVERQWKSLDIDENTVVIYQKK